MTDLFDAPAQTGGWGGNADIDRDRWGRPLVIPPDGGKPVAYTRCTTYVDALDSKEGLMRWKARMTALGLAARPDLALAVQSTNPDDKRALDAVVDQALDAAKASAAATTGTALHQLTERIDEGGTLTGLALPDEHRSSLDAYRRATEHLEWTAIEQFRVHDELRIGGTADRVAVIDGASVICDIKGLALDTPIPTPNGWTTMDEVQVGDRVFDDQGRPCRVTVKSRPKRIGTRVVTFDDGASIVCDTEHIWWVREGFARYSDPKPMPITEIEEGLAEGGKRYIVPVAGWLELDHADLTVDPYVLGAWLGDGHSHRNVITKCRELFEIIASRGHELGVEQVDNRRPHVVSRSVVGLADHLSDLGLFGDKHIPDAYLRASVEQRFALLQGLMDTDGTWNTSRDRAVFNSTNLRLAEGVMELLRSLGENPHLSFINTHGFGKDVVSIAVEWRPSLGTPFLLQRKAIKADGCKVSAKSRRRMIVSVEEGPDVPTACIGVDSENHTYLCGEQMIPTHNTGSIDYPGKFAMQLAVYAHSLIYDPATGQRRDDAPATDLARGLIIHLPAGGGECTLHWIDLTAGWDAVQLAGQVRQWRSRSNSKAKDKRLLQPYVGAPDPIQPWVDKAAALSDPDELRDLWHEAVAAGVDGTVMTGICKARLAAVAA